MAKLKEIEGVSYNLMDKTDLSFKQSMEVDSVSDGISLTEKEQKNKEFFENYNKQIEQQASKRIGFLAQDLQQVFPELVDVDSLGYYSVDYIGLIPVIIEALKEQDDIITRQNTEIKELYLIIANEKRSETASKSIDFTMPTLEQNYPNPFDQETTINYYLPETINKAALYIYNMNGLQIKSISLSGKGKGEVILHSSELQPGMYIYILVADGKEVDAKRMILTQ